MRLRPERHFADSLITVRLVIARFLTRWLPRFHSAINSIQSQEPRASHVQRRNLSGSSSARVGYTS